MLFYAVLNAKKTDFASRNRASAANSAMAQSRIKALEKMQLVKRTNRGGADFELHFPKVRFHAVFSLFLFCFMLFHADFHAKK